MSIFFSKRVPHSGAYRSIGRFGLGKWTKFYRNFAVYDTGYPVKKLDSPKLTLPCHNRNLQKLRKIFNYNLARDITGTFYD